MWVEVLCWIDRVWSSKECACCACDPSVHLSVRSIGFVCVFVCQKFESWITDVYSPYVIFVCDLHTMWSGKSLQLLCFLPFCMLCLYAISMMFLKFMLAVGMVV